VGGLVTHALQCAMAAQRSLRRRRLAPSRVREIPPHCGILFGRLPARVMLLCACLRFGWCLSLNFVDLVE
jgi:hypothetical protein